MSIWGTVGLSFLLNAFAQDVPSTSVEQRIQTLEAVLDFVAELRDESESSAESALFTQRVEPILSEHCFSCHQPGKTRAGLDLTSRDALLQGGDSGPAIVSGNAAESLLMRLVRHEQEPAMPHKTDPLPADAIAVLEAWIDAGAPFGAVEVAANAETDELRVTDADRAFWSFAPLSEAQPPTVGNESWVRTPVDRFILAAQEAAGIGPAAEADRRTLIRRVYFDLIGLPPDPEAVETFIDDPDPQAYEKLVDQLLDDPRYGERWARHWLDVARYADSGGYEFDVERPTAYHYRDFVIRALNEDLPYDQFVQWQIAGDEYEPDNPSAIAATGFCTSGPTISNQENEKNRYDELDDVLSTTGSAFLGLTVSCARCHDHKYDPIPQRDYYRMLSAFTSSKRHDAYLTSRDATEKYQEEQAAWDVQHRTAVDALTAFAAPLREPIRIAKIEALPIGDDEKALLLAPLDDKNEAQNKLLETHAKALAVSDEELRASLGESSQAHWDELVAAVTEMESNKPVAPPKALALTDAGAEPVESYLLARGDPNAKQETIELGFLTVLPGGQADSFQPAVWKPENATTTFRRRALAEWLTDVDQGAGRLTARVIVNRLWHHHFGHGIVRTPNDFGMQGDRPSHPELLDWLASELIRRDWNLKAIHRCIVLSSTYRQSNAYDAAKAAIDPDNRLLWHRRPVRLEAEAVRDAMLAVSDCINREMYGPGVFPYVHPDAIATGSTGKWPVDVVDGPETWRRSVYIFIRRSARFPMMEAFDMPDTTSSCGRRIPTTTPTQSLALLNSRFVNEQAGHLAARLIDEAPENANECIRTAFHLTLGRSPKDSELARCASFLEEQTNRYREREPESDPGPERRALIDLCQTLLSLNEFVYVN
ncbi:MAG: hypothetical protein AMXMBFR82_35200 [Candidatus Hydrogenedentota bacterium]